MITRSQLRPRRSRRIQGLTPEYSQNRYNVGRRRLVRQGGVANVDNMPFNFQPNVGQPLYQNPVQAVAIYRR